MSNFDTPNVEERKLPRTEVTLNGPRDSMERTLGPRDSMASSPHTFHNALIALRDFIEKKGGNTQVNIDLNKPEAARWKQEAARLKSELQDPQIKQLFESKAATDVEAVNKFLRSKGFSIQLKNQGGEGLYVASVFKQQVEWAEKGKKIPMNFMDDSSKPIEGVEMKKNGVTKYADGDSAIYELLTKNGDKVFLMPSGNLKTTPIDLYQRIRTIHESKGSGLPGNTLQFPKVNLDEKGSIEWVIGAKVGEYTVNQAEYQNKLQMDENGAIAEAAVALATTRGISFSKVDTINGPFYVWFVKPGPNGKDVITFAARIGENAMIKVKN